MHNCSSCGRSERVPGAVRGRGAARGAAAVPRGGAPVRGALPRAGAAAAARAPAPHLRAHHRARPPLRAARPQGDRSTLAVSLHTRLAINIVQRTFTAYRRRPGTNTDMVIFIFFCRYRLKIYIHTKCITHFSIAHVHQFFYFFKRFY